MSIQKECPGHFGMIKLEKPVFHAELLDFVRKVLKAVCHNCSHLMADNESNKNELKSYESIANAKSRFNKVQKLAESTSECFNCKLKNRRYTRESALKIEFEILDSNLIRPGTDTKQTLWPEEAKRIFDKITEKHLNMLGLNKTTSNPSNMIIENLAVTPPPVRPSVLMPGCSQRSEDDLTVAYRSIIKQNNQIGSSIRNGNNESTINELRTNLQFMCATLMNNKLNGCGTQKHKSGQPLKAIRERLKGKEGRLR